MLAPEVVRRATETKIKKYGTQYPLQNKEIWNKCNETMHLRNGRGIIPTSKNQSFLCDLYGGKLNVEICGKYVDILLDNNICCEYDGGGHKIGVIRGRITEEDFLLKEKEREKLLVNNGYKIFRIVSRKDKILSNNKMVEVKNKAKEELLNNGKDIYIFDIDSVSEKSYAI